MNPHRLSYGFAFSFPFAMVVGVLTIGAWLVSKEPKKLPMTPGTVLMLAFALWMSISTVFATDVAGSFKELQQVIKMMVITLLSVVMLQEQKKLDWLIWVIAGSIAFFAVKGGAFSLATGGNFLVFGPPGSVIEENNALAVATIMVVPLVRYLHMHTMHKWVKRGLFVSMPLMIISALSSYSRGALIAMSMMALFLWLKSKNKVLPAIVIIVVATAGLNFMPDAWFERMDTISEYEEDASAIGRLNSWSFAYKFTLDHPFFGGGFMIYDDVSQYRKYEPNPDRHVNAHSIYFQVMAMHGFVGLLLFLSCILVAFLSCSWVIRNVRVREDLVWARDLAAMIQVSIVGYATGGAFLNLAYYDLFWHIAALSIILRLIVQEILKKDLVEAPVEGVKEDDFVVPQAKKSFLRADAKK